MFGTLPLFNLVSQPFKRSQLGLFHGKMRQSGNNVPFSKHKTKRTWLPNVQSKRLHSEALGERVRVKLTTKALKTIKKVRFNVVLIACLGNGNSMAGLTTISWAPRANCWVWRG
jgi:ribosomal protein L28